MAKNNLHIIHYLHNNDHYLCNQACKITHKKITIDVKKVVCKNCLRSLKKIKYVSSNTSLDNYGASRS